MLCYQWDGSAVSLAEQASARFLSTCIACTVLSHKSALAGVLHGDCITFDLCEVSKGDYGQVHNVAIDDSNLGMHRCG